MHKRYLIRGRVQGVGFRWFVEREAKLLGITGWVRNNADGAVEVLACGSEAQLEALRKKLQTGSRGSRVDHLQESEVESGEDLEAFRIEGAW